MKREREKKKTHAEACRCQNLSNLRRRERSAYGCRECRVGANSGGPPGA